jgi:hypothetical protein
MSDARLDVHPAGSSIDAQIRRLLHDARAGIQRSRRAIVRTSACLEVAQQILAEESGGGLLNAGAVRRASPTPRVLQIELDNLRSFLYRVTVQVANERADLGMEAAELYRLTVELQRHAPTPPSGAAERV